MLIIQIFLFICAALLNFVFAALFISAVKPKKKDIKWLKFTLIIPPFAYIAWVIFIIVGGVGIFREEFVKYFKD